jgi:hypothetical protein
MHARRRRSSVRATAVAVFVLTGCGSDSPSATTLPGTAVLDLASPTSVVSTAPPCPNREGGACLGALAAGTYETEYFSPRLWYTVPDGWSNFEDVSGNFLLVPPSFDLTGVNAGTSDFIGVYSTVSAPDGCEPETAPGVGVTPRDLTRWFEQHPGLTVTSAPTTVGGRSGFVLDVRMRSDWTTPCPYSNGTPIVPMLFGTHHASLEHNIGPGQAWRLYLLENEGATMAIEVDDIADAGHLDDYADVVESMIFSREHLTGDTAGDSTGG